MKCPKCGCEHSVKNGKVNTLQRYKCKNCNYQFTRETLHEVNITIRAIAVTLCAYGMSFRSIADFLDVSHTSVMNWFRAFAEKTYERPEITEPLIIELDEMWHFCGKKNSKFGYGKPFAGLLINLSTGSAAIGLMKHSEKCGNDCNDLM